MSRKPTKGYYVRGHFVAEGSEMDLELKREMKGSVDQSRTDLKKESDRLQLLGMALLDLRADLKAGLDLPDKLLDAVQEAKRITNFEGRRRQMQFIGKLMRKLDVALVQAIETALVTQQKGSADELSLLHQAEDWRDQMLAGDAAVTRWLGRFQGDAQHLRALCRQARKDAAAQARAAPPEGTALGADAAPACEATAAPRQGKAYKELFQLVKAQLLANLRQSRAAAAEQDADADDESDGGTDGDEGGDADSSAPAGA